MAGNVSFSGQSEAPAPRSPYTPSRMPVNMEQFGLKAFGPQPEPSPNVKYATNFQLKIMPGHDPDKPQVAFSDNFKFSHLGVTGAKGGPRIVGPSTMGPTPKGKFSAAYKVIEGAKRETPNQGGKAHVAKLHPSKHAGKLALELARAASV